MLKGSGIDKLPLDPQGRPVMTVPLYVAPQRLSVGWSPSAATLGASAEEKWKGSPWVNQPTYSVKVDNQNPTALLPTKMVTMAIVLPCFSPKPVLKSQSGKFVKVRPRKANPFHVPCSIPTYETAADVQRRLRSNPRDYSLASLAEHFYDS